MAIKTKKIFFRDLEIHDREKNDSLVRLIEMKIDAIVPSIGYSIQFWKDVRLYGVDEAIQYLKGHITEEQLINLLTFWEEKVKTI